MKKALEVTLGIMTAVGGFVDIGDFVFAGQAGAKFGFSLLWALVVGTIGIIIYAELSGRIAAVAHRPVFSLIRDQFGHRLGLATLVGSELLNILTCAAEVGGLAFVLKSLVGLPYPILILISALSLVLIYWLLPFEGIERLFGLLGLAMLVFIAAAVVLHPHWSDVARGFIPSLPPTSLWLYLYFAVGIISATLMPYEIYFYSSGGIEEQWKPDDIPVNRLTSGLGFALGSFVVIGIIIAAAQVFGAKSVTPDFLGVAVLPAAVAFGQLGLLLALVGLIFSIGGAALETSFSGAYNLAQYFGWKWGRRHPPLAVPKFTVSWLIILALAIIIILTGVDPVKLTEYAVIFSVVVMPFTYLPVLLVAGRKEVMGDHASTPFMRGVGWVFFGLIVLVALAAVPLMIITRLGQA